MNEKINAIAPKITEKGATVIVEQISSQFVATVNGVIFEMFNQIGVELEEELPDIKQFEQYLFTVEEDLPDIHDLLISTNHDADEAEQIIKKAQEAMPEAKDMAESGLEAANKGVELLTEAEIRLHEIGPKINEDLKNARSTFHQVNELLQDIQVVDVNKEEREAAVNDIGKNINAVDLMREAVGGIIWRRAIRDIIFLVVFGLIFALAGLLLKGPVNKRLHKLLQSKGSRLFH